METIIILLLISAMVAVVIYGISSKLRENAAQREQEQKEEAKRQLKEKFDSAVEEYKKKTIIQKTAREFALYFIDYIAKETDECLSNVQRGGIYANMKINFYDDGFNSKRINAEVSNQNYTYRLENYYNYNAEFGDKYLDFYRENLQVPKSKYEMCLLTVAIAQLSESYFREYYSKDLMTLKLLPEYPAYGKKYAKDLKLLPKYDLKLVDETNNSGNRDGDSLFFLVYKAKNPNYKPHQAW